MASKLRTRTEKQQIPSVNSAAEPVSSLLASRPFVQAKATQPTSPSTTPQPALAQSTGHNLSNIAVFSSSTVDTPIAQRKRRRQPGKPNSPLTVQTSLEVGEPGDMYEQEADRTAFQVVDRIEQQSSKPSSLQQKAATAGSLKIQPLVQTQAVSRPAKASAGIEQSIESHRGGGEALSGDIREPMEQQFGADFGAVRVHTDANSDTLNRSLNSQAFTTKNDIFFKKDAYNPGSRAGKELIAHELTHVVQQSGGSTIQRKSQNLTTFELSEKDHNKKYSKTKDIYNKINEYNTLPFKDKDYGKQKKLLSEVQIKAGEWLKKFGSSSKPAKQEKKPKIEQAAEDSYLEINAVMAQEEKAAQGQEDDDTDWLETANEGREGISEVKETAGEVKGNIDNIFEMAKTGKAIAEKEEVQEEAAKTGITFLDGFLKTVSDLKAKAQAIVNGLLSKVAQSIISGVVSLGLKIYSAYNTYKEMKALQETKESFAGKANLSKDENNVRDAAIHGYGKVRRRFWSSIWGIISTITSSVCNIITLLSGGTATMVTGIITAGLEVINGIKSLVMKGKGFFKWLSGKRGKNRAKSANSIFTAAKNGNAVALKLLVDLDPMGFTGRAKRKLKGAKDIKQPKNIIDMQTLIDNIVAQPALYGTMDDFKAEVAEKLKSQAD
ncbi:DUF4157 domain-containing protein [Pantanalinema rosaneae CENA516]|uniref:eCIS core domain-containing protein n=1 Tax=Pantanalinema rosaneae TaxID=1620701 RepID=UPI003D6EA015